MNIEAVFQWLIESWEIQVLVVLIVVDIITGIALALRKGEFDIRRMSDFLVTNVLPYILVYGAFQFAMMTLGPEWEAMSIAVFGFITVTLLGSVRTNLEGLGLNIPLPDFLRGSGLPVRRL